MEQTGLTRKCLSLHHSPMRSVSRGMTDPTFGEDPLAQTGCIHRAVNRGSGLWCLSRYYGSPGRLGLSFNHLHTDKLVLGLRLICCTEECAWPLLRPVTIRSFRSQRLVPSSPPSLPAIRHNVVLETPCQMHDMCIAVNGVAEMKGMPAIPKWR